MEDFGFKELYDIMLKTTYDIEINGKTYNSGETIIRFDKIQVAAAKEDKVRKWARGGYGNEGQVFWEETVDIQFTCSQGVISKEGLALLTNSSLSKIEVSTPILVPKSETLISNSLGIITLKYIPKEENLFIYNIETGVKITPTLINGNQVTIADPGIDVLVDYYFDYLSGGSDLVIGKRLFNGELKLEGKLRLKDDLDGHDKTGILTIPRVKLMSDLSLRLGQGNNPMMSSFMMMGYPVGGRKVQYVASITMLNNDIDSDF